MCKKLTSNIKQVISEIIKNDCVTFSTTFQDELTKIKDTLTKTSNDWKVRVDSLSAVRSLMVAGATNQEEFLLALKTMEVPFIASVKDLRSQVSWIRF